MLFSACKFFLSFFMMEFPRILNLFPYFLFLIANAPKKIHQPKNKGKRNEMKKN
jgi:hypothetical protein